MVPGQVITPETIDLHAQARREGDPRLRRGAGPRSCSSPTCSPSARARRATARQRNQGPTREKCDENASSTGLRRIRSSCCSSSSAARSPSARSPSRATAWAWWPRRSWSAPASRPGRRPTASRWSSTTSPSRLFYYLFMYGVGLRVGPSFINSLKGDGLKFTILAVLCSFLGPARRGAVRASCSDLPAGAAGGILAGSMTMSAAIGSAEEAVTQGAFKLADGPDRRAGERHDRALLRPHLHLGHGRHHPDLQVPAALVGHRRQGGGEEVRGGERRARTSTTPASPATGRSALRAYRLENAATRRQDRAPVPRQEPGVQDRQRRGAATSASAPATTSCCRRAT